ncbi:ABC transporter ATP-binding protein [Streptomyces sp. NBC_00239]|uniref:ABC transporter ATP-binding protein n=1 Tax=Streptomyces sp. NBC_00239 TaxID=2903640 RepID=UPI002E2B4467|nr:ABC transporter ATP-binding protein [Streptomyces sp. NBC_00239]
MTAAVHAENLVKRYEDMERNAVDGLSFTIEPGAVVGLLGPNGAGKTTLTKLICGAAVPTAGRIAVFGAGPSEHGGRPKADIGVIHQSAPFDMMLTVLDNLRIAAAFKGVRWRDAKPACYELLDVLGIKGSLSQLVFTLSGGEKRRLQLVRALLGRPRLLLLDEPSAGLDVSGRHRMWELLHELRTQEGTTVLWTSHYVEELERNCGRVLIVDRGRLVEQGTPDDLAARYGRQTALVRPADPENTDRLAKLAGEAGLRAAPADGVVRITGHRVRELLPDVLTRLGSTEARTASVEFRTPSLEDAFLELVENPRDR